MMTVRGYFDEITTTADIDPDHPEKSWVEATIQAASIRTNHDARDDDLRSANFLDVKRYPVITFKCTGVEPSGPDRYLLTGDLTIKGITRPVTLEVVKYGEFNDPGCGAPDRLRRHYQDQPEGLRPGLQHDAGWEVRRQRRGPDHDRGRTRRADRAHRGFRQLILRMAPGAQRRSYALTAGRRSVPGAGAGTRGLADHCAGPGRVGGRQRCAPPGTMAT
jgi:hypothetical protein